MMKVLKNIFKKILPAVLILFFFGGFFAYVRAGGDGGGGGGDYGDFSAPTVEEFLEMSDEELAMLSDQELVEALQDFYISINCGNVISFVVDMGVPETVSFPVAPPACVESNWSPSMDTVCSGINFTQTSNCGTTRSAIGTKDCNNPPIALDLVVSQGDCCIKPNTYSFSWTYSDPDSDLERRFQFLVYDEDGNEIVSREYNSLANPSGAVNTQAVILNEGGGAGLLDYNSYYSWQVRVWDSGGKDSGLIAGPNFSTIAHPYPEVNFNWSPETIFAEEKVYFVDESMVFGGTTIVDWLWNFEDGQPATQNVQSPVINFLSKGEKTVSLQITDSDSFSCSASKVIKAKNKLPNWREILPF